MTWANYIATGSGSPAWRLDLGGYPFHFVTRSDMESAGSLGVAGRIRGLSLRGQELKERANIPQATIDVGGFKAAIVDVGNLVTAQLARIGHPTATTWLGSNATASATTVTVSSTTDFASSGYVWIDSECISYTGVNATQFTGCTRGVFNTLAQAHYVPNGAFLRYPAVTNQPLTLEGQRVRLYGYGDTDTLTGAGEQIYTGVVSSDPRWDGTQWTIGVDPVTRVLAQKLGSASAFECGPRGIYYPGNGRFNLTLRLHGTASISETVTETVDITVPDATTDTVFFENNDAFCAYVNTKIAASAAGSWITQARMVSDGDFGWHVEIVTDTVTLQAVSATTDAARGTPGVSQIDGLEQDILIDASTGASGHTCSAGGRFIIPAAPGKNAVPRGTVIGPDLSAYTPAITSLASAFPDGRIYIGGLAAPPSSATTVQITWPESDTTDTYIISHGSGYVTIPLPASGHRDTSEVRSFSTSFPIVFNVNHGTGGVRDFIESVASDAPDGINLGTCPDMRLADWGTYPSAYAATGAGPAFLVRRFFAAAAKATVGQIVSGELQCAGQFLSLSATGLLRAVDVKAPVASANSSGALHVLGERLPVLEISGRGAVNTLTLKTRYMPHDDSWDGPDVRVRDVAAFGRSPAGNEVTISRRSRNSPERHSAPLPTAEVVDVASRIFGIFGAAYAEVTLECAMLDFAKLVGDVVTFSSTNVPASDGTMGVTDKVGVIVAREYDLTAGIMRFTVLIGADVSAGYCPSAQIATESNVSGNIWDVTLANTEAPTGTASSDWFEAGDAIRVWLFDNTTPAVQTGEVTSVTAGTVRITLDGAATLGTGDWILEYDAASAWTTNPDPPFLFLGTSAGRVSLPTALPAWVFSP